MSTGRAHENTPLSPPEMSRLHFTKFLLSKGKSLVSGGGAFSFQRGPVHPFICGGSHFLFSGGRCILSSAVPEYLLSRQLRPLEGKTHVHRARYCSHFAAVGSLRMPSATLSLQNRGRWKPFYMSTGRAHENTSSSSPGMPCLRFTNCLVFASENTLPPLHELPRLRLRECLASASRNAMPSPPGMPRLHFTKCSHCKGKSLMSVAEVHFFICSRSILFSAWPMHPFICGTGASADQTAAAVGRQNACPSGAVLQPFRGRRQFEYAIRHTFPAKSRPLEAILYIHRARSRKYLAFASENALPPLYEMPRLRLRECLAFTLRNASPSPPGMPRLHFTKCSPCKGKCSVSG